jgi:hypothetical protein
VQVKTIGRVALREPDKVQATRILVVGGSRQVRNACRKSPMKEPYYTQTKPTDTSSSAAATDRAATA